MPTKAIMFGIAMLVLAGVAIAVGGRLNSAAVNHNARALVRKTPRRSRSPLSAEEANKIAMLLEQLQSPDKMVRIPAIIKLGIRGRESCFEPLAAHFDKHTQWCLSFGDDHPPRLPMEVIQTADALWKIDRERALPYVMRMKAICTKDQAARKALLDCKRFEDIPALVDFAMKLPPHPGDDPNHEDSPHSAMISAFHRLQDRRAEPYLISMLTGPHPLLVHRAADALMMTSGKDAYALIANAMKRAYTASKTPDDDDPKVVTTLIAKLGNTNDKRGCAEFISILTYAKNIHVRRCAAYCLASPVDLPRGKEIYRLWTVETDAETKDALKRCLVFRYQYGYIWDANANDFKKHPAEGSHPQSQNAPDLSKERT